MDRVEQRLLPVISRIWPEMADLSDIERQNAVVTFGALLYIVPLSLIGFVWLAAVSNLRVLSANWGLMLALFALIAAFQRFYLFLDRKSTRLNSSHVKISYAVFCLKKKKTIK